MVKHVADRIAVMYLGRIVEIGAEGRAVRRPAPPLYRTLLSAIPRPDPHRSIARHLPGGDVPSPMDPPPGCRFHTRCPFVIDRCRVEDPELGEVARGHLAACHRAHELPAFDIGANAAAIAPNAARRLALYAERRSRTEAVAG